MQKLFRRLGGVPIALGKRGVLAPGRWCRWRAVGWLIALFALVLGAFGVTLRALNAFLPAAEPHVGFLINVTAVAIAMLAYGIAVRLGEFRLPSELSPAPAAPQLALGLVVGTLMFAAVMAILAAGGLYRVHWHGPAPAWHAAGLAIQAGAFEELLVRGVMLRLLWRAFGAPAAFAVSVVFFGASHLFNPGATPFAALCVALEAGVMLGAFYALTGRLWISIGVHIAWNFAQGYLFGAAVSGNRVGPALTQSVARADAALWATGGAFGPEASLAALAVCATTGTAVLVLAYRKGRLTGRTLGSWSGNRAGART